MPSNLYGNANPNPLPTVAVTIGNVDIGVPANVETNCVQLNFPPAVSPGWYYPWVQGVVTIVCGASAPSFLNWGARIGAGSDFAGQSTRNQLLVANAQFALPLFFYGIGTFISNPFTVTAIFMTATAGTNGFTVSNVGTGMVGGWLRAPDQ